MQFYIEEKSDLDWIQGFQGTGVLWELGWFCKEIKENRDSVCFPFLCLLYCSDIRIWSTIHRKRVPESRRTSIQWIGSKSCLYGVNGKKLRFFSIEFACFFEGLHSVLLARCDCWNCVRNVRFVYLLLVFLFFVWIHV